MNPTYTYTNWRAYNIADVNTLQHLEHPTKLTQPNSTNATQLINAHDLQHLEHPT
jgi:hypothetical protein